jgi:hypothetical protein
MSFALSSSNDTSHILSTVSLVVDILKNYLKYRLKCIKLSFTNRIINIYLANTKFPSDQSSTNFPYQEFLESSYGEPLINWNKPTPIWKLLKQCRKTAERGEKLLKKLDATKESSTNSLKSVPKNATITKEYIKCGKPLCHRRHGPYYYAYWKDTTNGKLKKKYIGKYFKKQVKMNVSSEIHTTSTTTVATNPIKDIDRDKPLHNNSNNNNKTLHSLNNLDKARLEQEKKKKEKQILAVAN